METTETYTPLQSEEPALLLTSEAQHYLKQGGKWAVFLAIIGFIVTGFILLGAVSVGSIVAALSKMPGTQTLPIGSMTGFLTIIYIIMAVLYFIPSLFLYQFGDRVKRGVNYADTAHITSGLGKLKSFLKFWGIVTIIIIAIYILSIIGVILYFTSMTSGTNVVQ